MTDVLPYRVIQWATGQLGSAAVIGIASHPDLKLVGAWVHSEEKEGRDVGELVGVPPLGAKATRDKDALLAMPADCVCYMAARTWTQSTEEIVDELARILRSGKNVVNATWPALLYPAGVSAEIHDKLQAACVAGGSTLYTTGIDPGYGSFGLAMAVLNTSRSVRSVHTYEICSYANYANPDITKLMGFGQPDIDKCPLLQPGAIASMFESSVRLLAKAMDVTLDAIIEDHQVIYAQEGFDIASGHIAAGTISGMRFSVKGMIGGEARFIIEHVTRLRDEDFPEVDFHGHGYRVEVDGEPSIRLDMDISSTEGDSVHGAFVVCAMAVVNAIPQVCAAPPGILTYLDLLPHPSKNLLSG